MDYKNKIFGIELCGQTIFVVDLIYHHNVYLRYTIEINKTGKYLIYHNMKQVYNIIQVTENDF